MISIACEGARRNEIVSQAKFSLRKRDQTCRSRRPMRRSCLELRLGKLQKKAPNILRSLDAKLKSAPAPPPVSPCRRRWPHSPSNDGSSSNALWGRMRGRRRPLEPSGRARRRQPRRFTLKRPSSIIAARCGVPPQGGKGFGGAGAVSNCGSESCRKRRLTS